MRLARRSQLTSLVLLLATVGCESTAAPPPASPPPRLTGPVRPATPEECVVQFWTRDQWHDLDGAALFLSEPYRTSWRRMRGAFLAIDPEKKRLSDAVSERFGREAAVRVGLTSEEVVMSRPREVVIRSVRVEGDTTWVRATDKDNSRESNPPELVFLLRHQDGGWFIFSDWIPGRPETASEDAETMGAIFGRELAGITAVVDDVTAGKITSPEDAHARFIAAGNVHGLEMNVLQLLSKTYISARDNDIFIGSGNDDYFAKQARTDAAVARSSLEDDLGQRGFARAAARLHELADWHPLPLMRGRIEEVTKDRASVTLTFSDARGGAAIATGRIELVKDKDGTFIFPRESKAWAFVPVIKRGYEETLADVKALADDVAGLAGDDAALARVVAIATHLDARSDAVDGAVRAAVASIGK